MGKKRMIDTDFWTDSWVVDTLNPLDSHLFIYLFTNPQSNIAGVYKLSLKVMSQQIGLEREELARMLKRLEPKVRYVDGWVILVNGIKHQNYKNSKIKTGIEIALESVPPEILQYVNWPKDYDNPKPAGSTQQSLLGAEMDDIFSENDMKKGTRSVAKLATVDKIGDVNIETPDRGGRVIHESSHSNSSFNSNSNTAVTNEASSRDRTTKTGTTGLKNTGKYMEVNLLYEDLGDLINHANDDKLRGWYCKSFFTLGRERVQRMASEARADAQQDKRKLFSHMLKEAVKTTSTA